MEERAHLVLDRAFAMGVRYFDAARSYGRAEEFLGSWLKEKRPAGISVASKWGYTYTAQWNVHAEMHEVKDHSPATFDRQWAETRLHLGDSLTLYQIHSATLETGVLENKQVLARLAAIRSEGVRVGLSVSGPGQADTVRRAADVQWDQRRLFDSVQATYNLLERSAGPALAQVHSAGMTVIVKEALANGRLTHRNTMSSDREGLRILRSEAARLGTTIDAVALSAVLAEPFVDIVLSGAATVEQLDSNLSSVSVAFDGQAHENLDALRQAPPLYWGTRAGLAWQ